MEAGTILSAVSLVVAIGTLAWKALDRALSNSVQHVKDDVGELFGRTDELQDTLDTLEKNVAELSTEVAVLDNEVRNRTEALSKLDTKLDRLINRS